MMSGGDKEACRVIIARAVTEGDTNYILEAIALVAPVVSQDNDIAALYLALGQELSALYLERIPDADKRAERLNGDLARLAKKEPKVHGRALEAVAGVLFKTAETLEAPRRRMYFMERVAHYAAKGGPLHSNAQGAVEKDAQALLSSATPDPRRDYAHLRDRLGSGRIVPGIIHRLKSSLEKSGSADNSPDVH